jgi:hypothetical protein
VEQILACLLAEMNAIRERMMAKMDASQEMKTKMGTHHERIEAKMDANK